MSRATAAPSAPAAALSSLARALIGEQLSRRAPQSARARQLAARVAEDLELLCGLLASEREQSQEEQEEPEEEGMASVSSRPDRGDNAQDGAARGRRRARAASGGGAMQAGSSALPLGEEFAACVCRCGAAAWGDVSMPGGGTRKSEGYYELWALQQQAERGDNPVARGDKPMWATGGGIDFDGRERWERWEALRGTCREDAMLQYVDLLKNRLGPESFEDGEVRAAGAKPDNAD